MLLVLNAAWTLAGRSHVLAAVHSAIAVSIAAAIDMLAMVLLAVLAMLGVLGAMALMLGLLLMLRVVRSRLVALVALGGLCHGRRDERECRCGGKKNGLHVIIS